MQKLENEAGVAPGALVSASTVLACIITGALILACAV